MAYIYDLTDTWNAGGTTFNAIKMNVTDSASAAASKLVTLQTNGTEHFSVTKGGQGYFSGSVGIGTSSPGAKLHLAGSADIRMTNTANTGGFDIGLLGGSADPVAYIYQRAASAMTFATNNTERMRIDASGNLLVGTTSASGKLAVKSDQGEAGFNTGSSSSPERANLWYDTDGSGWRFNIGKRQSGSFTSQISLKDSGQLRFVPLASAPSGAEAGDVYYDSGTNKLRCYNGTTWNDLF